MKPALKTLAGYDNRGIVFDDGDRVFRRILPPYVANIREILELYQTYELPELGIVETCIAADTTEEFLLQHHKHRISYPFEWSLSMVKDALLFHLDLFIRLDSFGLTLKDALPNNILFDHCKPYFVDFCSLIRTKDLRGESWLVPADSNTDRDLRFVVFERMFIPYMLIPFLLLLKGRAGAARQMLFDRACNTDGKIPGWDDLVEFDCGFKRRVRSQIDTAQWSRNAKPRRKEDFLDYCHRLREFVNDCQVASDSSYVSYYERKNETFDFDNSAAWKEKQRSVFTILGRINPASVVDLGANTGWFSRLAERQGANVVSMDVDETSIDVLYSCSKRDGLKILPLLLPFENLEREKVGVVYEPEDCINRRLGEDPLFSPATQRLQGDLVLCLALVHHLILGRGLSFESFFKMLALLSRKAAVVEFVDLSDELIQNEPNFFRNLSQYNASTYNLDVLLETGHKYFKESEFLPSHPSSRKLVLFKK